MKPADAPSDADAILNSAADPVAAATLVAKGLATGQADVPANGFAGKEELLLENEKSNGLVSDVEEDELLPNVSDDDDDEDADDAEGAGSAT